MTSYPTQQELHRLYSYEPDTGETMPDYPDEDGYETDAAGTFQGVKV